MALASSSLPKKTIPEIVWKPNPGPQERFLRLSCFEALYGGAAGGGKSDALLIAPLRWVHHADFEGILFRRTYPELEKSLIKRSLRYYQRAVPAARYNDQKHFWTFPSGARIYFGHLEHEDDVRQYQSAEFQYIAFDELTSFTEAQYRFMLSRARSSTDIPIRIRAGTNPGDDGHEWVQRRWGPWLGGPEWKGPQAEPGELLHYLNTEEGEEWVDKATPRALSRVFIPARVGDNPRINDQYVAQLDGLDHITRAQLRDGNWLIRPSPGKYFRREWFKFADAAPAVARRVRRWDLAATEADPKKKADPDWTVGMLVAMTPDKRIWVEGVVRFRGSPGQVEASMKATAEIDGQDVEVSIPQDPGQAGKFQSSHLIGELSGFEARSAPETGDKVVRAGPVSAQVEVGNVTLVRGEWNNEFIREAEAFPTKGVHDDQIDALSGAFLILGGPQIWVDF